MTSAHRSVEVGVQHEVQVGVRRDLEVVEVDLGGGDLALDAGVEGAELWQEGHRRRERKPVTAERDVDVTTADATEVDATAEQEPLLGRCDAEVDEAVLDRQGSEVDVAERADRDEPCAGRLEPQPREARPGAARVVGRRRPRIAVGQLAVVDVVGIERVGADEQVARKHEARREAEVAFSVRLNMASILRMETFGSPWIAGSSGTVKPRPLSSANAFADSRKKP